MIVESSREASMFRHWRQLLPYSISFVIPALVVAGLTAGGLWSYATPLFVFGLLPILEGLTGDRGPNPDPLEAPGLARDPVFSRILTAHLASQYTVLFYGCWVVTQGHLSAFELAGSVLSMGIMSGGIGINIAHELIHKASWWEQLQGKLMLLSSCYMHFYIEHLRGHHRHIATERDPASARLGESFWSFYPRTVVGSWKSAWSLESERLRKANRPHWSRHNQMLQFAACTAALALALALVLGPAATAFYLVTGVLGFSLLEVVNYVEHYGLFRKRWADGRFEPVDVHHSWNSNHYLGRWLLFELTRHSDHHLHASRRYQVLRNLEGGPRLPAGYPTMVLLALVPPLWHKVMDSRAREAMSAL